ncbi:MAG: O-acetyl-ADP-ribose deacetylase [Oscillospiraceae bacterium]|nr:O-acetyl-ADP-ribose deacetylase [Oscillospiraceae bacterium]
MPLQIIRNDITKMQVDAIVNAANSSLLGGGGVDGAIHRAAGPGLLAECRTLGGCKTGEAKITGGYDLPAKHVIHTVGPVWRGGDAGEPALLASCYRESLKVAVENGCKSVAFPLISAGIFGYPKAEAMHVAVQTITDFLRETEDEPEVWLVIFDRSADFREGRFRELGGFLRERFTDPQMAANARDALAAADAAVMGSAAAMSHFAAEAAEEAQKKREKRPRFKGLGMAKRAEAAPSAACDALEEESFEVPTSLGKALDSIDESFSQMLLRLIDERGMTDAECYKKANIDRKLFSKIRGDVQYRPKKVTVIAFAIALELDLDETKDMLMKAGYALSHSSKFDIIVEYYIRKGKYDVYEINEALFAFDQMLIGA